MPNGRAKAAATSSRRIGSAKPPAPPSVNTFVHPSLAPVFAVLPEFPSVSEVLSYQLTGLMVVFIALGLIWVTMEISGTYFKRRDASLVLSRAKTATAAAAALPLTPVGSSATARPAAPADAAPDAATLALIVAAVYVALDARAHRIITVTPANEPLEWSREGRRDIFTSHRFRMR